MRVSYTVRLSLIALCAFELAACHGNSSSSDVISNNAPTTQPPVLQCDNPLAPEVQEHTVVSYLPNSYDSARTDNTTDSPNTVFYVAVHLPERCPEDRFPVVIESHGYSGSRDSEPDEDGIVTPSTPHFSAIDELFAGLYQHGYVGISYEQRGHGDSVPENGGGYARVIDPEAETQDGIALLDWIAANAYDFFVRIENKGIANDFVVGTIGYSYGGGFQFPLAFLDERIDTIVPNGTWHSLINSLVPGDAMKSSFVGLLCLLADTGGVVNTPAVARMCELVGYDNPQANTIRTLQDLIDALSAEGFTEEEVIELFDRHVRYFQLRHEHGEPWCTPGTTGCTSNGEAFTARPVPTLLLQGNRDILFNMTSAYWNWDFYRRVAGGSAPVSVLTTEGGHMNPLANQVEGSANCGALIGVELVRAWFDFHLKGQMSAAYQSIPKVCISVADTTDAHNAPSVGLILDDFPVGSQSGIGGVPARLEEVTVEITTLDSDAVFVPVATISGDNQLLAGVPSIDSITVTDTDDDSALDVAAIAYIGTGIQRDGELILVDDQLTAVIEGSHSSNPNIGNERFLLPGVGERLRNGDQVGLILYQRHVQYSAIVNANSVGGITGLVGFIGGLELPPVLSALDPVTGILNLPNPYQISAAGVEIPVIDLDTHPTARLSQ